MIARPGPRSVLPESVSLEPFPFPIYSFSFLCFTSFLVLEQFFGTVSLCVCLLLPPWAFLMFDASSLFLTPYSC